MSPLAGLPLAAMLGCIESLESEMKGIDPNETSTLRGVVCDVGLNFAEVKKSARRGVLARNAKM